MEIRNTLFDALTVTKKLYDLTIQLKFCENSWTLNYISFSGLHNVSSAITESPTYGANMKILGYQKAKDT